MTIKIITDSACDLPIEYIRENNIDFCSLSVNIKGDFIVDDFGQTLKSEEFFNLLKNGEMTSTAQVNIGQFEEVFRKNIEQEHSIIYIGLSSALSGTFNSASIARENIVEEYPDADITIINSKSASLGEGALVYYACEMMKEGKSKDEIVKWVEAHATKVIHAIAVDDLSHLKRGGRISGATAMVGGLLNIKPTITLDEEGKVAQGIKLKGRKKVLRHIASEVKERGVNLENQVVFVCHADSIKDAEELREMILSENKVKDVVISSIGTVIGTHVGPGALAAIFIGEKR